MRRHPQGKVGESQSFDYTGSIQQFTAPFTGIYKFEVYGAKGGAGGGLTGGDGATGYNVNSMGKGGTQTSGGVGGAGTPVSVGHYHNGESGAFGLGGNGYSDTAYEGNSGAGGAGSP